jgi:hypothetical protein
MRLRAVPRDWFESVAPVVHEAIGVRLRDDPGTLLLMGRDLTPGAVYRLGADDANELRVNAWDPEHKTEVEVIWEHGDTTGYGEFLLRSAERPRKAEGVLGSGSIRTGLRWVTQVAGGARLDLDEWWDEAGNRLRKGGPDPRDSAVLAPLTAWVRHGVGSVYCGVTARRGAQAEWRLYVDLWAHGHGLFRPPVTLGLLLFRRRIHRLVEKRLAEVAARWNEEIPGLISKTPEELGREIRDPLIEDLPPEQSN